MFLLSVVTGLVFGNVFNIRGVFNIRCEKRRRVVKGWVFMTRIIYIVILILYSFADTISAEKATVAVLNLKTDKKTKKYGEAVTGILTAKLIESGKFSVIERTRLKDILNEHKIILTGLAEGSQKIGRLLGVKYLIFGSISALSGFIEIDIRMVEAESGIIVAASGKEIRTKKGLKDIGKPLIKFLLNIYELNIPRQKGAIGVLNFTGLEAVSEILITEFVTKSPYTIVERSNLDKILAEYKLDLSGVIETETMKDIGRLTDVETIVTGNVSIVDKDLLLYGQAIDVTTGELRSSATLRYGRKKSIRRAVESLAKEMLAEIGCEVLWKFETQAPITSSVLFFNEKLIFGGVDGCIYCLDRKSGNEVWKYKQKEEIRFTPVIVYENLYFLTDRNIYCLDIEKGSFRFKLSLKTDICSPPCYVNGNLYFGARDSYLYAVDITTRRVKWRTKTGWWVTCKPTECRGILYFGSGDGYLYAADAKNGKIKWKVKTGSDIKSSPTVSGKKVYVGSDDHYIYCFNLSGKLLWKYETGASVVASPVVKGGVVYVGSLDNTFYALDAKTGELKWKQEVDGDIKARAYAAQGKVYVTSTDGNLYIIDDEYNEVIGKFKSGGEILSSPIVKDEIIYITSTNGNIYAIKPPIWR